MSSLFSPIQVGTRLINNRIAMAPLTRARTKQDIADERTALYYTQRSTAGLIVSEGTPISKEGQGYLFNPGIFTSEQVEGWRTTTSSVHAVGGTIFAQLWHVGRVSHESIHGIQPVSSSSKQAIGAMAFGYQEDGTAGMIQASPPRALDHEEIKRVIGDFSHAAVNAIEAGFDGVEIHGANGYLVDQFINPKINNRTDSYSGETIENRIRFAIELVDAAIAAVGSNKVAIRLSPYCEVFDMPLYEDIDQTFIALVETLGQRKLAYVHFMDHPRSALMGPQADSTRERFDALLKKLRLLLPETPIVLAGGMTLERASQLVNEGTADITAFGRAYISNPDLVDRLARGWPLAVPDQSTFYGGGAEGYIDYPPYQGQ
ncbi:alkene reductase [Pseudomonas eucalypticola]|uniref:Alkene reductase n=1 Tax=Pseudomonas eucalypticola TaxID=2599595 RepID=A0A7D5D6X7_9PSED|nr:alkene reductase [Pseudomonas eucalypticola]QKZ04236.1 alkene reductase [Pseudomonas eucalypticola]